MWIKRGDLTINLDKVASFIRFDRMIEKTHKFIICFTYNYTVNENEDRTFAYEDKEERDRTFMRIQNLLEVEEV